MGAIYKPILFSTEMVQALDRKTLTRRTQGLEPLNNNTDEWIFDRRVGNQFIFKSKNNDQLQWFLTPKFLEGNILWVRETWKKSNEFGEPRYLYKSLWDSYKTGIDLSGWKPSIHMPKAAARIFLEVVNVRCERLHDIKEEDAIAEGIHFDVMFKKFNCYLCDNQGHIGGEMMCEDGFYKTALNSFSSLWQSINGKRHTWQSNPWVWVYEFKKIEKPTIWPQ